ncbi:hypothetical protein MLD38_017953 [Melastoma candidum]|uniref:Uncharacterized protein n=1 Tax=Melastoma candidum TaxID=119954 RepID=A0ACB9QS89_9MYRT|nr:hypothetical protein MLD38_017953 [Melastoma candidum]
MGWTYQTFESADVTLDSKKCDLPGYATLNTPKALSWWSFSRTELLRLRINSRNYEWRYLFALFNRKPNLEANIMKSSEGIGAPSSKMDQFMELMLPDVNSLSELLIKCSQKSLGWRGDPLFSTLGKLFDLRLDMILLENQIPLFVLQRLFQCAMDLRAGSIQTCEGILSRNFLDAKFTKGVLRIPSLSINQCTGRLFRNLVALEQCGCVDSPCIASYVFLIHGLISSKRDEKLLVDHQVITNSLDVGKARKVQRTAVLTTREDTNIWEWYDEGVSEQVNEYVERRRPFRPRPSSHGGHKNS